MAAPKAKSPHVAVIGAGVSGLRCASVLLEHSFDVTIFEARDRYGGRICQSNEMGKMEVDMFVDPWLRGYTNSPTTAVRTGCIGINPIVELAKATDTPLHLWEENTLMLDAAGNLVDAELASLTLKRVWNILEQSIETSTADTGSLSQDYSLFDHFTAITSKQVDAGELSILEQELVLHMAQMWGAYVGDRVERQSMKFFFLEDCIEGDDRFIPSNYKRIMEKIAELPVERDCVRYNSVVESVQAGAQLQDGILITIADGDQIHFDTVVITVPLGYLKRHKDSIRPLDDRISKAIDSISYGRLEKVLIEFPSSFWESTAYATKEDDRQRISFVHWLSPSYAAESNPDRWRLECVSFSAFPAPYRRNILLFYTFGDCSTHLTSSISSLSQPARDRWLEHFFEPYYSRLPNYEAATCKPLRFLATQWSQDEFAGFGSYSNFQIGMGDAARDVESIRQGMPDRGIFFAGEHTAPFDGLGTVAGAYNSGEKVANRIIELARTTQN